MKVIELDENTKVPLRVLVSVIGLVISATIWLTLLSASQSNAVLRIDTTEHRLDFIDSDRIAQREKMMRSISELQTSQARIEGKIDLLLNRK